MKNTKRSVSKIWNTAKVLLGMMLFCVCLFGYSFESMAAEGTIKAASANIRSEANASSTVLASVKQGDEVSIKAKTTGTDGNVWYQVFVNANTLGFIRSDLIDFDGTVGEVQAVSTQNTNTTQTESVQTDTASGEVESMPNQSATITGGDVNVRASASTSSQKVTKATNGTAITVTGKMTGSDGKVWYQVTFIADGKEINGFVRSDYVELGEIIEQPVEEEPTPEPEEPEAPVQSENKAYDTVLETKEDGTQEWYLYDNAAGFKYSIPDLMAVTQNNEDVDNAQEKQFKQQKIIIIVLVVVVIVLVLGLTLVLFKLHESEGFDDDEDDEDMLEQAPVRRRRVEGASEQPARRPVQGGDRPQRRPAQEGTARPRQGSGSKPASRPVRNADGEPVRRPVQSGDRPQRRPAQEGATRPAQGGTSRPTQGGNGNAMPRQAAPKPRPAAPKMPEKEVTFEEEPKLDVKKNQNGQWHSKNFLAEDDEFEFEFLNMDDPNRL